MECGNYKFDKILIRKNELDSPTGDAGTFTNVSLSDFSGFGVSENTLLSNFTSGTNVYENHHYMRLGAATADAAFAAEIGNAIDTHLGYKPAKDFKVSFSEILFAAPHESVNDKSFPKDFENSVDYYHALKKLIDSGCQFDLLMIDTENLVAVIFMKVRLFLSLTNLFDFQFKIAGETLTAAKSNLFAIGQLTS